MSGARMAEIGEVVYPGDALSFAMLNGRKGFTKRLRSRKLTAAVIK
jgi:hypothetical protein